MPLKGILMQDDDYLVAVGEFANEITAQAAIALLSENNITAQMDDEGGTFDLGIGELSAIRLVVTHSNLEKAKALLADLHVAQEETCPAWTCGCGEEVDEGFFACWSCGNEYKPS
jgi:hypothetical protein